MEIKPFKVEEWMNAYEEGAKYNIAETCVDSVSLDELFELAGEDKDAFLSSFSSRRLTYGDITGSRALKEGISSLYRTAVPELIVPTHGAAGANHHVFISLISSSDHVISIMPTYQQLYSIPESIGAEVSIMHLRKENGYLPDLGELRSLIRENTKMICINNPNNPSGALIPSELLGEIISIARDAGAYILSDEVYRHLTQEDIWCESIADLYEKGISVGSMSKVFSLAGLRMGWIFTHDEEARRAFLSRRDYNLISCGMFDDAVSALALKHKDALLGRNRGIVRNNLRILSDWIAANKHFSFIKPQAGTTALVYYDYDIPSYDFCLSLYRETGAFVTPGDAFGEERCMRIGYGSDTEALINGLNAIAGFASSLT